MSDNNLSAMEQFDADMQAERRLGAIVALETVIVVGAEVVEMASGRSDLMLPTLIGHFAALAVIGVASLRRNPQTT